MVQCNLDDLPPHLVIKILGYVTKPKELVKMSGVNHRWLSISRSKQLWRHLVLDQDSRVNLKQLTLLVNSPWAVSISSLSLEGFVIRSSQCGTQSSLSNHVLTLMSRKLPELRSLRLFNVNMMNISIKNIPKSIESLSCEGCIILSDGFSSISKPGVLPNLKHLDLNYVHNLDSSSESFTAILRKKKLDSLQLRHCFKISKRQFCEIGSKLLSLRILNLSEIATLDDSVLEFLAEHKNLVELYVAFTLISDQGITKLCQNKKSKLTLLDIRGCPKVTSASLLQLNADLRLNQVFISKKMVGASSIREELAGRRMKILDEVDLKKVAIGQDLSRYSAHFGDALTDGQERADEPEPVEALNFFAEPLNADYFGF